MLSLHSRSHASRGNASLLVLSSVRLRSSVQPDIYYQYFRPCGDFTFSWSEEKPVPRKIKATDTERFLIQIINGFYNASALTVHPCAKRA
jgi:hypothetical protein